MEIVTRPFTPEESAKLAAPLANGHWILPANRRNATDARNFRNPPGEQGHTPRKPRLKLIRDLPVSPLSRRFRD